MKKFTAVFFIFIFSVTAFSQKLTEPKLLGTWLAGEDASEFLYHKVLETSLEYMKENPDGRLMIRICTSDDFPVAFVKAQLNPLFVTTYGFYSSLNPQKTFIVRSSKCLYENKFNSSEYWFVPDGLNLENEEKIPLEYFYYKEFEIYESEETSAKKLKDEFDKNTSAFVEEMKNHPENKGFIIHNSKNEKMKRNIASVLDAAKKEGISIERIKTITKPTLDVNEKGKLYFVKDEKESFPNLAVIEIKKIKL